MDLGELPIALGHSLNALAGRATHWRALQARPVPRSTARLHRTSKLILPARGGVSGYSNFLFVLYFFVFYTLRPKLGRTNPAAAHASNFCNCG
jgi:hypothetical protein